MPSSPVSRIDVSLQLILTVILPNTVSGFEKPASVCEVIWNSTATMIDDTVAWTNIPLSRTRTTRVEINVFCCKWVTAARTTKRVPLKPGNMQRAYLPAIMIISAILLKCDNCVTMETATRMRTVKLLKYDGNRQMDDGCISLDRNDTLVMFSCCGVLPADAN